MLDGVLLQAPAGLIAQDDPVQQHGRFVALGLGGPEQLDGHLGFARTRRGI